MSRISQHPTERDRPGLEMALAVLKRRAAQCGDSYHLVELLIGQISNKHAAVELPYEQLLAEVERLDTIRDKLYEQLLAEIEKTTAASMNVLGLKAEVEHLKGQFAELHVARNLLSKLSSAGFPLGEDAAESILAMRAEVEALRNLLGRTRESLVEAMHWEDVTAARKLIDAATSKEAGQ